MNDVSNVNQPRQGLGLFDDGFENLFEGFLRPMRAANRDADGQLVPPVDITEEEKQYVITAELPGIDKKDIDVSVNDGVLTIRAERKAETEDKDKEGRLIRRESRYGQYSRSMRIDRSVDVSKVSASHKDGLLRLVLPKTSEAVPQKIEIGIN